VSGTTEITSAVVASTLTIMVVFLPLMLIKGQAGQMFTQFALVVMFSIAVSLLDATTVVPMLASRLIVGEAHHENATDEHRRSFLERQFQRFGVWFDAMDNSYRNGLQWSLRHRWAIIGGAVALSAASFLLVPSIGTELMPATDSGDFQVQVKMPVGTALAKTNQVIQQVEQILISNPNVATAFSAAGTTLSLRGSTTALNPNQGSVTVKLKDHRKATTLEVMNDLRKQLGRLPGAGRFRTSSTWSPCS